MTLSPAEASRWFGGVLPSLVSAWALKHRAPEASDQVSPEEHRCASWSLTVRVVIAALAEAISTEPEAGLVAASIELLVQCIPQEGPLGGATAFAALREMPGLSDAFENIEPGLSGLLAPATRQLLGILAGAAGVGEMSDRVVHDLLPEDLAVPLQQLVLS